MPHFIVLTYVNMLFYVPVKHKHLHKDKNFTSYSVAVVYLYVHFYKTGSFVINIPNLLSY